jgi:hypothetical protein
MASAERTLVKSQPELWQLIDHPGRMEGLASGLLGHAAEIEITERDPETKLAWEASVADEVASIEVALEQDGWGTNVSIVAKRDGLEQPRLEGWIEAVLDEFAEPKKRPFEGIV